MKREFAKLGEEHLRQRKQPRQTHGGTKHGGMFQEQGEDIQRKEAELGRAVGLVYKEA